MTDVRHAFIEKGNFLRKKGRQVFLKEKYGKDKVMGKSNEKQNKLNTLFCVWGGGGREGG